ncbi:uncharacterized protein LOC129717421 [Wyeomyia smithii]|uniref:uncharacterized protein LOC129717421 n=1 Tax=Wyeomyia smithii TaxID=174621 RepID=UPI002467E231|nr:uncharacterized protein LOC129717421 [Wyeomyia smithii]
MSQSQCQSQSDNKRGKNWSEEENEQLCRSWVKVTKDPIKETDQQKGEFWKAVKDHAQIQLSSFANRPTDGIRQRFATISHQVAKYVGCLAFVNRLNCSGTTKDDQSQEARKMFLEDTGLETFKIQACYDILKDEPKFKELQDSKNLMKRKRKANISAIEEDAPVALPSNDDTQPSTSNTIRTARPVGQTKAKKQRHNVGGFVGQSITGNKKEE